ncbi:MAG: hypothetical protein C5B52_11020 [Bacteroidetes bacterium]|nr:MAG: hypothetical protein C5B52_11020 [Bacteroidota bacterium]
MFNSYHQYKPGLELQDYVECIWIWKSDRDVFSLPQRLIPGGRMELMFNLADPMHWMVGNDCAQKFNQSAILMGQRDKIFYVQQKGRAEIAGIRFKPGGLSAFSKSYAKEFLNLVLPAEFVFGKGINDCLAQIAESDSDVYRVLTLEKFLVSLFKSESKHWKFINPAVEYIRNTPGQISIAALCEDQNTYYKKLERSFLECVGYTPKSYNRIVRFNQALRLLYKGKKSLTEIGYDCDYFDQSHFIKDFHLFTGTSPSQFVKESNYVAEFLVKNQPV